MSFRLGTLMLAFASMTSACTSSSEATQANKAEMSAEAVSWWKWHDEKRATDEAVAAAENDPRGADYAKAVAILRKSGRPQSVIDLDVGGTIVGGHGDAGRVQRYPVETIAEGLALVERAALSTGESKGPAEQQLRMMFERGVGDAFRKAVKPDPVIAACWLAVEENRPEDPRRCIALRKQRTGK